MNTRMTRKIVLAASLALAGTGLGGYSLWAEGPGSAANTGKTSQLDRSGESMGRQVTLRGKLQSLDAYMTGSTGPQEISAMPRESTGEATGSTGATGATGTSGFGSSAPGGLQSQTTCVVGSEGLTILSRLPSTLTSGQRTSGTDLSGGSSSPGAGAGGQSGTSSDLSSKSTYGTSASDLREGDQVQVSGQLFEKNNIRYLRINSIEKQPGTSGGSDSTGIR